MCEAEHLKGFHCFRSIYEVTWEECKPCSDVQPAPALNKRELLLLKREQKVSLPWAQRNIRVYNPAEALLWCFQKVWVKSRSHFFSVLHSLTRSALPHSVFSIYSQWLRANHSPSPPSPSLLCPLLHCLLLQHSILSLGLSQVDYLFMPLSSLSHWKLQSENKMVFTQSLLYVFDCFHLYFLSFTTFTKRSNTSGSQYL